MIKEATTNKFRVAGHVFAVTVHDDIHLKKSQYMPFATDGGEPIFHVDVYRGTAEDLALPFTEESRNDSNGQTIVSGITPDGGKAFTIGWGGVDALMVSDADYRHTTLYVGCRHASMAVDFSLMLIFAFNTAKLGTLSFHASTVVSGDKAYLFLGVSGTGKSTHSRLWMENIEGTWLLNDDHPVLRIDDDGIITAYGSPWSGKTPCYIADSRRLGALVQLSQGPENRIRRLKPVEAYVNIVNSVASKRWESRIADGIHHTAERIIASVGCWHLECLPDADAALLCYKTVK